MNELKKLKEKRNAKYLELEKLLGKAEDETRALTEKEQATFEALEAEVKDLDKTIALKERARALQNNVTEEELNEEARELEDFGTYVRALANHERAADVNYTTGENGAIVPTIVAKKVIETLEDICPIYEMSEHYNVAGKLTIPKYVGGDTDVVMDYADEFVELTATAGKFESVDLNGFLAGCLAKISKSLIKKATFNLTSYVISKVALATKRFLERECLIGTAGKIEGLRGVTLNVTAEGTDMITSDELIDLQEEVIDEFQENAVWIMNRKTRKAIRKLKDGEGNYLLQKDFTSKWGYTLLGKPVCTSDRMPTMAAGNKVIYYGDYNGLATKIVEQLEIQVLVEKYATQHAIGVVAWTELDAAVQNTQMIASLTMAATAAASAGDEE